MKNQQEQVIQRIIDQLVSRNLIIKIDKIYLFGSRARQDAAPRSDFDIAISGLKISTRDWLNITNAIDETDTLLKIDALNFEQASTELQQKILKEGKLIYERTKNKTKF